MGDQDAMQTGFVPRRLPWVIGLIFLVLYSVTLNRWVTPASIGPMFQLTGWDWAPQFSNPLLYVLTLPFRWFPESIQPLALNALGGILAALTMVQLARSIALLPHDRTRDQRQRERSDYSLLSISSAWVPPLFGCLLCGLQRSFWEEATSFTGEMLSVFLFAYLIRCVLEFRLFHDDRWLYRLGLIYGFAVPCDWAFIGYFPLFLGAIVWIKGAAFFNSTFLLRTALLGGIGLFSYLLLPALIAVQGLELGSFVDLMKLQLGSQKTRLMGIPKTVFLLLSLTSVLPVMVMGIRFPSTIGDVSVLGSMLSNFMFRMMHMLFLSACVWVAFDPAFSPRNVASTLQVGFLTFYYLGALAIGYYAGYVLLVFGKSHSQSRRNRRDNVLVNGGVRGLLWIAVVVAPLGLLVKNLPSMRLTNGDQFSTFAEMLVRDLPEENALLIADEAFTAQVVRAGIKRQGLTDQYTIVDLSSLGLLFYRNLIRAEIVEKWEAAFEGEGVPEQLGVVSMLQVLAKVVSQSPVFYLNSSFGVYFEVFYPRQRGLVTQLVPYVEGDVVPPPVPDALIVSNQEFWSEMGERMPQLASSIRKGEYDSQVMGGWVSRELNVWGVTLQRQGRLEAAKEAFDQAWRWNPENLCVDVNLRQNQVLLSAEGTEGRDVGLSDKEMQVVRESYGTVEQLLSRNGPIDEAAFLKQLADEFGQGQNHRQALLNYQRSAALSRTNLQTRLALTGSFMNAGFPDRVPEVVAQIRTDFPDRSTATESELVRLEALGLFGEGRQAASREEETRKEEAYARAEGLLKRALESDPENKSFLETLAQFYLFTSRYEDALALFDRQLTLNPNDPRLLQNKALAHMNLGDHRAALASLTIVLDADPLVGYARLNRAICYFRLDEYESAKADYLKVIETVGGNAHVFYGLGKIAVAEGNATEAISHFEDYLKLAPSGSDEYQEITEELNHLKTQP